MSELAQHLYERFDARSSSPSFMTWAQQGESVKRIWRAIASDAAEVLRAEDAPPVVHSAGSCANCESWRAPTAALGDCMSADGFEAPPTEPVRYTRAYQGCEAFIQRAPKGA